MLTNINIMCNLKGCKLDIGMLDVKANDLTGSIKSLVCNPSVFILLLFVVCTSQTLDRIRCEFVHIQNELKLRNKI